MKTRNRFVSGVILGNFASKKERGEFWDTQIRHRMEIAEELRKSVIRIDKGGIAVFLKSGKYSILSDVSLPGDVQFALKTLRKRFNKYYPSWKDVLYRDGTASCRTKKNGAKHIPLDSFEEWDILREWSYTELRWLQSPRLHQVILDYRTDSQKKTVTLSLKDKIIRLFKRAA